MISAKAFGTFAAKDKSFLKTGLELVLTLSKDRVKEIASNNLTEDNLQNENNRSKNRLSVNFTNQMLNDQSVALIWQTVEICGETYLSHFRRSVPRVKTGLTPKATLSVFSLDPQS